LPRHHLQRLGDVLAELGELAAAARAGARRGARTGFFRVKLMTDVVLTGVAIASSSAALASSSSSCNSSWSSRRCPRSEDCPYRSRFILAISSFRCATIASAPEAQASACCRAARSATSAAFRVSISSRISSGVVTSPIISRMQPAAQLPRGG
jgi:hypothetical protein